MSAKTQVLLANGLRTKKEKVFAPAWQQRRLTKQERMLRYQDKKAHNTITARVYEAIKDEKELDVGNVIDYVHARWNVKLTPTQVYGAACYLRKTNRIAQYNHTYNISPRTLY